MTVTCIIAVVTLACACSTSTEHGAETSSTAAHASANGDDKTRAPSDARPAHADGKATKAASLDPSPIAVGEPNGDSHGASNVSGSDAGVTDAATPITADEPSTVPALRNTASGEPPVFDPNQVYLVGQISNVDPNASVYPPWTIAPLNAPEDTVWGIDFFAHTMVRRSDGHLLYFGDELREFRRDALPSPVPADFMPPDIHAGEVIVPIVCPAGSDTSFRSYLLAWDETIYHSCRILEKDADAWFGPDGTPAYDGNAFITRVGAQNVAIGYSDTELQLVDFLSGAQIASLPDRDSYWTVRMHEGGFIIAYRTLGSDHRWWINVDLTGKIIASGDYAALPEGVTYVQAGNSWSDGGAAVIDDTGRLYEFAVEGGDNLVVVRRPAQGTSEVRYRAADWSWTSPHALLLIDSAFITGG